MGKHNKQTTSNVAEVNVHSVNVAEVNVHSVNVAEVNAVSAWYTSQAGVAQAIAAAGAHWGAVPRVPASHRWLAAAAWVAGAHDAYQCHAWAAAAAQTMGWPTAVVPPVTFCKANWLFAIRRGTPYVQTAHGVTRAVAAVTATPVAAVTATPALAP
jgi:hypothetical protein